MRTSSASMKGPTSPPPRSAPSTAAFKCHLGVTFMDNKTLDRLLRQAGWSNANYGRPGLRAVGRHPYRMSWKRPNVRARPSPQCPGQPAPARYRY